jgi:hypothetical protein
LLIVNRAVFVVLPIFFVDAWSALISMCAWVATLAAALLVILVTKRFQARWASTSDTRGGCFKTRPKQSAAAEAAEAAEAYGNNLGYGTEACQLQWQNANESRSSKLQ